MCLCLCVFLWLSMGFSSFQGFVHGGMYVGFVPSLFTFLCFFSIHVFYGFDCVCSTVVYMLLFIFYCGPRASSGRPKATEPS